MGYILLICKIVMDALIVSYTYDKLFQIQPNTTIKFGNLLNGFRDGTTDHANEEHLVEEREEGIEVVLGDDATSLHARQEVEEKARLVQTHHLSVRTL